MAVVTIEIETESAINLSLPAPWNAVSAFANCGRAVAHVRGSYVPKNEPATAGARCARGRSQWHRRSDQASGI